MALACAARKPLPSRIDRQKRNTMSHKLCVIRALTPRRTGLAAEWHMACVVGCPMNESDTATQPANAPWTCPFCPLLCDTFGVDIGPPGTPLKLVGSDCPRAARNGLAHFDAAASAGQPQVDGRDCDLDTALAAAASLLAASRQPLFGGLGTDVAGARALYALACETGAICDPAQGKALMHGLRALQDRGGFSTTLAEVHTRADLIVCMTEEPTAHYPEFFRRCGAGAREDLAIETFPLHGDLFDTVALLAALVAGRVRSDDDRVPAELGALSARLKAARYAVLVYESARLPAQGALIIEAIQRIVGTLNRSTRAASLPLGGGDGASTVNQVFAWLSGSARCARGPGRWAWSTSRCALTQNACWRTARPTRCCGCRATAPSPRHLPRMRRASCSAIRPCACRTAIACSFPCRRRASAPAAICSAPTAR